MIVQTAPISSFDSHAAQEPTADEIWRPVAGADGFYSVSSLGRVRSESVQTSNVGRQRGRVLACCPDTKGYLQFRICLPGGYHRTTKVHRVVALAFLGPRPPGCQVNHKSGDKLDNSVGNLEYVTCRQNIHHGWNAGLYRGDHSRGEKNPFAKLKTEQVRQIRGLASTRSPAELAGQFGVGKHYVKEIIKGNVWKHVV